MLKHHFARISLGSRKQEKNMANLQTGKQQLTLSLYVLAIINSAAMNIGVHVSLSLLVSSVCMPSSGIAGS